MIDINTCIYNKYVYILLTRIAMAKLRMIQLYDIWKDRGIPTALKLEIMKCLVWHVMTYGCEAWTMKKDDTKK